MKRNIELDLFRIYLAISILLFHRIDFTRNLDSSLYPFFNGRIAVEGFFLIIGYFFARDIIEKEKSIEQIIKGKLKSLLPILLFSLSIHFAIEAASLVMNGESLNKLFLSLSDFLLLNAFNLPMMTLNITLWFISAMIVGLLATYPLIKHFGQRFCTIYSFAIALFIYGLTFNYTQTITYDSVMTIYISFRAIAGILMGVGCYGISIYIKKISLTQ